MVVLASQGSLTRDQVHKHTECGACDRSTNRSLWLYEACRGGHVDVARMMLTEGADVHWKLPGYSDRTALTAANESGSTSLVALLRAHEVSRNGDVCKAASMPPNKEAAADEDDMFSLGLPAPASAVSEMPEPAKDVPCRERKRKAIEAPADGLRDKRLPCRDCGQTFVFTAEKQRDLAQRGFKGTVKTRCEACVKYKKNRFGAKLRT